LQNGPSGGITEMINGFLDIIIALQLLFCNNCTAIIKKVKVLRNFMVFYLLSGRWCLILNGDL